MAFVQLVHVFTTVRNECIAEDLNGWLHANATTFQMLVVCVQPEATMVTHPPPVQLLVHLVGTVWTACGGLDSRLGATTTIFPCAVRAAQGNKALRVPLRTSCTF
jgi:hypothetical protein